MATTETSADFRVLLHVGAHAAPEDRLGTLVENDRGCNLRRRLFVRAVECHGADRVSRRVEPLTEGVLKAMSTSKLKVVVAVVVVLGFLAGGSTGLIIGTTTAQGGRPPGAERKVKSPVEPEDEKEKEAFTAWGKEVRGLQAGLGFKPGEKRAYHTGETVTLVVRIRNVSKNQVQFYYHVEFLNETTPAVADARGDAVPLKGQDIAGGPQGLGQVDLEPGKEIELRELKLKLRPASEAAKKMFRTLYGTGTFHIQYKRLDRDRFGAEEHYLDESKLSKLATGKLKLEVKADPPAAKPKTDPDTAAVEKLDRAAIQGS